MKNKLLILRIAVPTPLRRLFDYLAPKDCQVADLKPGVRVKVPFQNRELIGVLVEVCSNSSFTKAKLKQAIAILDQEPVIPPDILELSLWAAEYYHHPVGDVLDTALPVLLRQGKPVALAEEMVWRLTPAGRELNPADIKRAPRQIDLLNQLRLFAEGLTPKQLSEQGFTSGLIKNLADKNYIEKVAGIPANIVAKMPAQSLALNAAQEDALNNIRAVPDTFQVFLLDGVTGSGKTEVYLQAITDILAKQKQVLILVPEIGLTPQTIQRFRERFAVPVLALHSGLSDKERLNVWIHAKSGYGKIIIGTRSAIFSSFANLGLIVVDEEHDLSFKQQEGFRYHARDLAIMRASKHQIPIILGSATPSLETLCRVQQGKYQHICLPERAGNAQKPTFTVLDIRKTQVEEGLSPTLLTTIKQHLSQGNQVMLFLNRRGFAPVLMCHGCGWVAQCKRCDKRMTYHHEPSRLHCHHCDSRRPLFKKCENCNEPELQIIGLGTERLEQALQKHFPDVSIARIDRDSTQRKGAMESLLESIHSGEHQILIGTQMLAKGHHFPNVTLVGIIDTDGGFFSADFRAIERMGQLLLQVSGRAGRVSKPGTVVIQTHHPEHPLLHQLIRESYQHFAASLLKDRENALLPPYAFLALFRAEAHNQNVAMEFLDEIRKLTQGLNGNIPIFGPVPAPMAKRAGRYRVQLLLQAKQRPMLQHHLKQLLPQIEKLQSKHQVRWSLDVDPLEMF